MPECKTKPIREETAYKWTGLSTRELEEDKIYTINRFLRNQTVVIIDGDTDVIPATSFDAIPKCEGTTYLDLRGIDLKSYYFIRKDLSFWDKLKLLFWDK